MAPAKWCSRSSTRKMLVTAASTLLGAARGADGRSAGHDVGLCSRGVAGARLSVSSKVAYTTRRDTTATPPLHWNRVGFATRQQAI